MRLTITPAEAYTLSITAQRERFERGIADLHTNIRFYAIKGRQEIALETAMWNPETINHFANSGWQIRTDEKYTYIMWTHPIEEPTLKLQPKETYEKQASTNNIEFYMALAPLIFLIIGALIMFTNG